MTCEMTPVGREQFVRFCCARWGQLVVCVALCFFAVGCGSQAEVNTTVGADISLKRERQANGSTEISVGSEFKRESGSQTDPNWEPPSIDHMVAEVFPNDAYPDTVSQNASTPNDQRETAFREKKVEGPAFREKLAYLEWEAPPVALFISGRQHGYIEPCGCTGLANQKGGLLRRDTLRKKIEEELGWPLIKIDAGNQIRRFGEQPRIKLGATYESLAKVMNYDAIAFGPDDLRLSEIDLLEAAMNNVSDTADVDSMPFVASNVDIIEGVFKKYIVIERGGKKIGVMTMLGDEYPEEIKNESIKFKTVDEAMLEVWPQLKAEECDVNILIAQTTLEKSELIANTYPHFDILVSTGGSGEPTNTTKKIASGDHVTEMVQVGTKGMYVGVIGIYDDPDKRFQYQRIPLDDRYGDSEAMKEVFIEYQRKLQTAGLEGLKIKLAPHPSGATFVGSKACADCHDYAYDIWLHGKKETGDEYGPHSHATISLVDPNERVWVPRYHDPECLSCHVTGWNPQRYFPYEGGFVDLEKSSKLHGNGCENCHGPGSKHVAAENGDLELTRAEIRDLQKSMVLTIEEAKTNKCMECHDLDNSPDFHVKGAFEEYWKRIEHNE